MDSLIAVTVSSMVYTHIIKRLRAQNAGHWADLFSSKLYPCNSRVRACLHGGGGPQVGEVTRLAVVEKWPAFTCKLTTPGSRGDFT